MPETNRDRDLRQFDAEDLRAAAPTAEPFHAAVPDHARRLESQHQIKLAMAGDAVRAVQLHDIENAQAARFEEAAQQTRCAADDETAAARDIDSIVGDQLMTTRSEEHTSELQSLMRISYAVFCLKKKKIKQ